MCASMMKPRRRARVVLVGSGRMGKIRAALLYANPSFELCAIIDIDFKAAHKLASIFSAKAFCSLTDAIEFYGTRSSSIGDTEKVLSVPNSAIDGVLVSSPTFTHEAIIQEAASNGLYIFVEKPVDDTGDKIRKLFDYCARSRSVLCCGFQRRFDHSYVATRDAIVSGKIGRPLMSSVFFADHPVPPIEFMLRGGNIFMDLLPHDLDFVRWCLEDEVASVYATGTSSNETLKNSDVHDNAAVVLKFKKGAVVNFVLSRSATYGYDQRCEVYGDKGLFSVGNEHASTSVLSDSQGVHSSKLKFSFPQRFNQAFRSELALFADCILCGATWPVTAEDCVAVQSTTDAAKRSFDDTHFVDNSTTVMDLVASGDRFPFFWRSTKH